MATHSANFRPNCERERITLRSNPQTDSLIVMLDPLLPVVLFSDRELVDHIKLRPRKSFNP